MRVPSVIPSSSYLTLIVNLLSDLPFENLRGGCPLQKLVLTKREETFEDKLAQRKANKHVLPREERAVEQTRQLLLIVSNVFTTESILVEQESWIEQANTYLKDIHD